MFRFLPLILKTLWRHRSRTILTVAGSATSLFVMCFVGAMNDGMANLLQHQSAKETLIVFQANKFCPASSHLPEDYVQRIAELPHVRDVTPIQVFTNNCRASLDVVVFCGLPAEKVRHVREFELISGSWKEFEKHQDAAIMGESLAARRNVKPGQKFSIGEFTVTVVGIFRAREPAEETSVYTHLPFLQRGQKLAGTVTQLEVLLKPETDATAVCDAVDELFRGGPVATQTRLKGVFQAKSLGDLAQILGMARYLGYACVVLVLSLVATTTFMSVQDRTREHAVLQTLGFTGARIFSLVLSESAILGLIGGVTGTSLAIVFLHLSQISVGAEAVTISFVPSVGVAVRGLTVSLFSGMIAGLIPAFRASRVAIVPALRNQI